MIKLSRLACYGVVILSEMSREEKLRTTSSISEATGLPEPTVAKILKLLSRGGLVFSSRGINGGYNLEKSPQETSIASIITALDGDISLTGCVDGKNGDCQLNKGCALMGCWDELNNSIKEVLEQTSLSDVMCGKSGCEKDEQ